MVKKILIVTAILIALGLAILWIVAGGLSRIVSTASGFNPVNMLFGTGTSSDYRLPWQPEFSYLIPRTSISQQQPAPKQPLNESKTFGSISPYRGDITINSSGLIESFPNEYVELRSHATAPINITGWSLESMVSGVRAYIPRGSSFFIMGTLNTQEDITLAPGDEAIVVSGASPVGTSLRENICTGYLGSYQRFYPPLSRRCPDPSEMIPLAPETIRAYGDSCIDYVRTILPCENPRTLPALSSACQSAIVNVLNYNSCVQLYRSNSSFYSPTWRIYLGASGELWRNTHDIIRLLDAEGRIVDSVTY